jgi:uncharacterized membrane protein
VYRFSAGGGGRNNRGGGAAFMIYADDGSVQTEVNDAMIDRAASAWSGKPVSEARKESVEEVDQWTVAGNLRSTRPLYKYSYPDGQEIYVSGITADVVQYTTSESRFWAYLGAIPHWLYFTPLRKHQPEWFQFVVWSSGIGTVAALMGIVVAVWMLSPAKRYRHAGAPTAIPYRGWKRWHTILGLFFGVVTTTWAFSGMLSMGPIPVLDRLTGSGNAKEKGKGKGKQEVTFNVATALRGSGRMKLADFSAKSPKEALTAIAGFEAKELELSLFDGKPVYLATNAAGNTRIVPVDGDPKESFGPERVTDVIRKAGGTNVAEISVLTQYDAYYLDRHREKPLPVVLVRANDEGNTRYYIDPKTGRVAGTYASRNWSNRWLYHGLHSLDFPWLYNYRPLWDIVVISLMLGGTAVCVTSLVLTWKVLQRKFAAMMKARTSPSEDLVAETTSLRGSAG